MKWSELVIGDTIENKKEPDSDKDWDYMIIKISRGTVTRKNARQIVMMKDENWDDEINETIWKLGGPRIMARRALGL